MSFNHVKKAAKIAAWGFIFAGLSACQTTGSSSETDINQVQAQKYNGPKARIAVARFTDKSNNRHWWRKEIGDGMADQLTTALVKTNKFIVLERQALDAVLSEQDLALSGRVSAHTGAAYGEIEGAELVIVAAVTEFDDGNSGVSAGGGSFVNNVFSSVSAGLSGTHMAIDLRLIDTRTSRILAVTTVEGGSTDFDITGAATSFGSSILGTNLSAWSNTPKEKALREVIEKAVEFLNAQVPDTYYRYNANNALASGKTAPPPAKKKQLVKASAAPSVPSDRMTLPQKMDLQSARTHLGCLGYLENFERYEDQETSQVRYDAATVASLKVYQSESNLKVSGRADKPTLESLAEHNCMMQAYQSGMGALANMFGVNMPTENFSEEDVKISKPIRQHQDIGRISVVHQDNDSGLTEIFIISKHKDSGGELKGSKGYLYKVKNQQLNNKGQFYLNKKTKVINSGTHYIKFAYNNQFFATGEVNLKKGVKNVVTLDLE